MFGVPTLQVPQISVWAACGVNLQLPPHEGPSVTSCLYLKIEVRENGSGSLPGAIPQVIFLTEPSGAYLLVGSRRTPQASPALTTHAGIGHPISLH